MSRKIIYKCPNCSNEMEIEERGMVIKNLNRTGGVWIPDKMKPRICEKCGCKINGE